jgi:signal transduction histidine kinase/DNA-binding NarL/FixJ family response regulator
VRTDLLKIYAKSNLTSIYTYIAIVLLFTGVRIRLYGLPVEPSELFWEIGGYVLILFASFLALMKTRDFYRKILSEKLPLRDRDCTGITVWIAVLKAFYMILWLYFLFMPVDSPFFYEHYLGYSFIFLALGIYASVSAAYLPLFLWDIGIQLGFAAFVLWLHRNMEATPYLGSVLLLFAFYTFVSGLRIRKTTKQLVETGYALKKAAIGANKANKSKSDFLAVMSHEIRTPMTGILGMVDFLTETKLNTDQKSCVDAITECSKTLLNTLNDILDLSKIEAGKLTISNINLDLHGLLENVVKLLKTTAAEKNIALRLNIDNSAPKYIYGDPHRIRQVVTNLVNNAIKFTDVGYVEVFAALKDGLIRIEIKDTGIGIHPAKIKFLFQPFSQADNTISRKYGGSGLGLSITKSLIEAMGGKIGMNPGAETGSVFWVELPYKEPVPVTRTIAEDKKDAESSGQNILLVEDNRINQMICSRLLTQKGHHITVASDGDSALELIRAASYDLVLMDCSLPGKSGLDITREIRALGGRNKRLPIIALTANGMEDHLKKCLEAGMNDCIVKPYEAERLYSVISSYAGNGSAPAPASNDRLKSIEDEMGPEYREHLIRSSLREIARLMQQIIESREKHDYAAMQQAAHDLKSVGGSIGMQKTQTLAETLEKACINKNYAPIPEMIRDIVAAIDSERMALSNL